jgi:acetyl esterase/lipase
MFGGGYMIKLWEGKIPGFDESIGQNCPNIETYILDKNHRHGAVIVCPGGGYGMKADHEGEPIARWLNSIGLSAFVLDYRVAPYKHPYPMLDAQRAVRFVRYNANRWSIDENRIGILGFSAGGHLASTVGTHFDSGNAVSQDPVEKVSSRPDAMILCYPVISFGEYRNDGSRINLIGEKPEEALINHLSNEKCVAKDTPPTFLWHTSDDEAVPVENSLMFAQALSKNKVNFALHVYRSGWHGLGLASDDMEVGKWAEECENWLRGIQFI